MQYKALTSFCGVESMTIGEVRELSDQTVIDDLLKAKYIEPYKGDTVHFKEKTTAKKSTK